MKGESKMRTKHILWVFIAALLLLNTVSGIAIAPTTPEIKVNPIAIVDPTKVVGSVFAVTVEIADVIDLYGWSFKLVFNKDTVRVTGITLPSPSFLRSAGPTMVLAKKYDNVVGYALVSEMLRVPYPPAGASGSGILATVSFTVVGVGVTALDLTETKLNTVIAGNTVPLEHFAGDGTFDNRAVNMPPVALFTVTPPIAVEGDIITFDASASHDDGWITSYFWNFGDGTNATTKITQHSWGAGYAGAYTVELTITDNNNVSTSSQYTLAVKPWMEAGSHPDLVGTLIYPEHPVFKEAEDGEHELLWGKIGNPTDEAYQVRVDFVIISKDEGVRLGKISTPIETILPHEIKDISADFFLGDPRWKVTTGPWNWPYWVKKYWAIGQCYYLDEQTGEWTSGIFPGANQFKIHPVTHDRAITAMSANYGPTNPAHPGDTITVTVTLENQGEQIEHDIPVTLMVHTVGVIGTATPTLNIGETLTLTFDWQVPADLAPGNYVFICNVDLHPYERDNIDNSTYIIIVIA